MFLLKKNLNVLALLLFVTSCLQTGEQINTRSQQTAGSSNVNASQDINEIIAALFEPRKDGLKNSFALDGGSCVAGSCAGSANPLECCVGCGHTAEQCLNHVKSYCDKNPLPETSQAGCDNLKHCLDRNVEDILACTQAPAPTPEAPERLPETLPATLPPTEAKCPRECPSPDYNQCTTAYQTCAATCFTDNSLASNLACNQACSDSSDDCFRRLRESAMACIDARLIERINGCGPQSNEAPPPLR